MATTGMPRSAANRPRAATGWLGRNERKVWVILAFLLAPFVAHSVIGVATHIDPPPIAQPSGEPSAATGSGGLLVLGPAYVRHTGKILEVRLAGTPEQIGHQHARLLHRDMMANEEVLYGELRRFVPFAPLRWLVMDISRVRFR